METITPPQQLEQKRILNTAIPGPRSQELHEQRKANVAEGFGVVSPVFIERADRGVLQDVDGNQLIDFASGIAVTSVGASNPRVAAAVQEQAERFSHTCFMVTEYQGFVDLSARLNELTPGDHAKKTALFTTGAEAIENAVKIARTATGRKGVVVLDHAYHGRTLLTMTMTAKHIPYKKGFGPFASDVYRAPAPYPFRWPGGAEKCAEEAFERLREIVLTQVGADDTAAIVIEPIQGEGGFVTPPDGYLPRVAEFAREHGIVFVADEIQTGLGRTGDLWACDHEGVVPDLVTSAKALAGGLPLSAVTGRSEIMDAVAPGGIGGTYAGNPIACAAALAALDVIVDDDLAAQARWIESVVRPRLEALQGEGSPVGDVRGRGAMLAIELTKPGTTEPDPAAASAIARQCNAAGVVTLTCGTFGNVIRLLPPLVMGEELLDDGLSVLESAVRSV